MKDHAQSTKPDAAVEEELSEVSAETASSEEEQNSEPSSAAEELDELLKARELRQTSRELKEKDDEIKSLRAKLADYEVKFHEARGYVKKLESEVQDIRLRAERDAKKLSERKLSELSLDLLPVLDLFELSLKASEGSKNLESFYQGVQLIHAQMDQSLQKLGLERIKSEGEAFDPHFHEAILAEDVKSPEQDGIVIKEIKCGYRLSGQVIRPAQVSVGKYAQ